MSEKDIRKNCDELIKILVEEARKADAAIDEWDLDNHDLHIDNYNENVRKLVDNCHELERLGYCEDAKTELQMYLDKNPETSTK
ncbi:MAG: hypothetical protein ACI4EH_14170 [Oliverpabstia sp.]